MAPENNKKHAPRFLISACLAGRCCRYDGLALDLPHFAQLVEKGDALPICPEIDGGLPTPRPPCELRGRKVYNVNGQDCSEAFIAGALKALELAKAHGIRAAILKDRSPSCGSNTIFDGTFSGRLISGEGVTAAILRQNGIRVFTEENAPEYL